MPSSPCSLRRPTGLRLARTHGVAGVSEGLRALARSKARAHRFMRDDAITAMGARWSRRPRLLAKAKCKALSRLRSALDAAQVSVGLS